MNKQDFSSKILTKAYVRKKMDFKGFSFRWLAKKMGLSHVYLSQIIAGKRNIPLHLVDQLAELLDIDSETKIAIYNDILKSKNFIANSENIPPEEKNWFLEPNKNFEVLVQWEMLCILQMTLLADNDGTLEFLVKKSDFSKEIVEQSVHYLLKNNFLEKKDNKFVTKENYRQFNSLETLEQIRAFHILGMKQTVTHLVTKVTDLDICERLINTVILTCSEEDVPKLKQELISFIKKFSESASSSNPERVYHLGLQFYPITKSTKN